MVKRLFISLDVNFNNSGVNDLSTYSVYEFS